MFVIVIVIVIVTVIVIAEHNKGGTAEVFKLVVDHVCRQALIPLPAAKFGLPEE